MRSKRIRRQIYDDPNRWLLSYADFMTLLFAFFVVMYAVSSVDLNKYKVVAKSVGYAFDAKNSLPLESASTIQTITPVKKRVALSKKKKQEEKDKHFNTLNTDLKQLNPNFYTVRGYEGWYEIEINASALFDSGEASLSKNAIKALNQIAVKLKKVDSPIIVEGYTDLLPIHNSQYASNWILSSARAAIVAQVLEASSLKSKQLSAVGYGSQYPIATNKTPEGRKKNRRVVIVIAKDHYSQRILNPINSREVLSQAPNAIPKEVIIIKTMKEVETKSGGLIFKQSVEEKAVIENKKLKKEKEQ